MITTLKPAARAVSTAIALALMSSTTMAQTTATTPKPEGDADTTSIVTAILTKEIVRIVEGNISAADRENGELNKLIRALSGVSVKDIQAYGICGGTNSEVRKILGSVCSKIK